ncbi:hypothetical protein TNCV_4957431 [Trichonephila clavipes]|nr:hypothetical protein TNCV_4957431 [Trichonephila clavipes]
MGASYGAKQRKRTETVLEDSWHAPYTLGSYRYSGDEICLQLKERALPHHGILAWRAGGGLSTLTTLGSLCRR